MILSLKAMRGYAIQALDGNCGRVDDVYFDDKRWCIRHLVVKTGGWLTGRRVLVDPSELAKRDYQVRTLPVMLTKQQVQSSPHFDTHMPVSRQREVEMDSASMPYGWSATGSEEAAQAWNFGAVGWLTMEEEAAREVAYENAPAWTPFDTMLPRREEGEPHLRSAHEVIG
ncbi:MAG: PRC-barrel domain-containing protein, partial [Armatimonadota bacterium]|nr:PRC-barrel domain-containing protein [Armatimonadota bacterium]